MAESRVKKSLLNAKVDAFFFAFTLALSFSRARFSWIPWVQISSG